MPIYLDHNATTPVDPAVADAMDGALREDFGNASSVHGWGQRAKARLDGARAAVAALVGGDPTEIIFTGSGTEADVLAVRGAAEALEASGRRHLVVSTIEHEAVLQTARALARRGWDVSWLGVDRSGVIAPDALDALVTDRTALVSVMHANNEVGTIQPIAELAVLTRAHDVPFHTDAVQAAGWLDLDVGRLGVQALSISGHKVGAPKGVGVLWVARRTPVEPLIHGGGQQRGLRSGTEDVAGAVGLATALRLARTADPGPVRTRRDDFIARVEQGLPGVQLTGSRVDRLPGHASFVLPGLSGESVLLDLERHGVICSSGSACAAGSDEASHVLTAMGIPAETAQTAWRFTFEAAVKDDALTQAADEQLAAVAGRLPVASPAWSPR